MRFLVKVIWDIERGNELVRSGELGEIVGSIMEELQPECAYFVAEEGCRSCIMVVHMDDASQIPAIAEPFFLAADARFEIQPAMVAEDLMKAGPAIEAAAKKYG